MMRLQLITSDEQHLAAMEEIDRLILANPPEGSDEANHLAVLGVLVDRYERSRFPLDRDRVEQALMLVRDETFRDRRLPTIVEQVLANEVMRLRAQLKLEND